MCLLTEFFVKVWKENKELPGSFVVAVWFHGPKKRRDHRGQWTCQDCGPIGFRKQGPFFRSSMGATESRQAPDLKLLTIIGGVVFKELNLSTIFGKPYQLLS